MSDRPASCPITFNDFLAFEKKCFGTEFLIAQYDPYLIRYGEYRFILEQVVFQPADMVLDLGCEHNIFGPFLASWGLQVLGIDLNPKVWPDLQKKKAHVEQALGREISLTFKAEDATQLSLPPNSVDKVLAVSSIEHMFSTRGHGDFLAIQEVARVLKPGGVVALSLPMSNGGPFHESSTGDEGFGYPYRLYTPAALQERILSCPAMEMMAVNYLAQTTPDTCYPNLHFFRFWIETLSAEERKKWAWANPILATIFNPIISPEDGAQRLETVNTALVVLRKKI